MPLSRRDFISLASAGSVSALALASCSPRPTRPGPLPKLSLAEWSLHRTLQKGEITNLDFPRVAARDFSDFAAVEYVNSFFKDKPEDPAYLAELKDRCDDLGIRSALIMCDGEGALGDPDETARARAVENHARWARAAAFLGCHSIRVNAESRGSPDEQARLLADGMHRLCEVCDALGLNCLIENHGGLTSRADWLVGMIRRADHPRLGTLPDFGNFYEYDRYRGVAEMMPYAKAVSAKSHDFDDQGNDSIVDYPRMLSIVRAAGYHGYLGVEYEGERLPEMDGIRATIALIKRAWNA